MLREKGLKFLHSGTALVFLDVWPLAELVNPTPASLFCFVFLKLS